MVHDDRIEFRFAIMARFLSSELVLQLYKVILYSAPHGLVHRRDIILNLATNKENILYLRTGGGRAERENIYTFIFIQEEKAL